MKYAFQFSLFRSGNSVCYVSSNVHRALGLLQADYLKNFCVLVIECVMGFQLIAANIFEYFYSVNFALYHQEGPCSQLMFYDIVYRRFCWVCVFSLWLTNYSGWSRRKESVGFVSQQSQHSYQQFLPGCSGSVFILLKSCTIVNKSLFKPTSH